VIWRILLSQSKARIILHPGANSPDQYIADFLAELSAGNRRLDPSIAGRGVLVLLSTLVPAFAAHAECALTGLNTTPSFPTQAAITAVGGVSASVGSLVSSINTANTAFLT
jgi:hypothetical protein